MNLPVQVLFAHDLISSCCRLLNGGQARNEVLLKFPAQKFHAYLRIVNFLPVDSDAKHVAGTQIHSIVKIILEGKTIVLVVVDS